MAKAKGRVEAAAILDPEVVGLERAKGLARTKAKEKEKQRTCPRRKVVDVEEDAAEVAPLGASLRCSPSLCTSN